MTTYGDREHSDFSQFDEELATIVNDTLARRGRVFIPTFALERAQEVVFSLSRLISAGRIGPVPIYIDSPLTEIYKLHPESLDPEISKLILKQKSPFFPRVCATSAVVKRVRRFRVVLRVVSLSPVLRRSDSIIGYTLGLSKSTVQTHLRRAITKMNVGSRIELIELANSTDFV